MSLLKVNEVTDLGGDTPTIPPYAGQILQVVSTTKTDTFSMASSTYADITGLSVSITPSSASSKIFVFAQIAHSGANNSTSGTYKITGGNTASYVGDAADSRIRGVFGGGHSANLGSMLFSGTLAFLDSPATTSATTYQVQVIAPSSETAAVNRGLGDGDSLGNTRGASTITVWEVAG